MCYDKIESGILVLHKEDLTPLPFLQECLNGFRAEAQERGVTLNFNPPSVLPEVEMGGSSNFQIASLRRRTYSFDWLINVFATMTGQRNNGPSLPLTETDTIHVDKFKVSE